MDFRYIQWLGIDIMHNYFAKGVCNVLSLVPTRDTSILMKNYSVRVREFENKVSFFCGINTNSDASIQQAMDGLDKLCFQIVSSDKNFINYTDISYPSQEGSVYFFSNGGNKTDRSALQQGQYVSAADQVIYKPFIFSVPLSPSDNAGVLSIKNEEGQEVVRWQVSQSVKTYTVNLKPYGEGRYTLWINDQLHASYFVSGRDIAENCIGFLQLTLPEIISVTNIQQIKTLTLRFNARSTYWKYAVLLAPDRQIKIKDILIEHSENTEYLGPVSESIVGGGMANVFTSRKPIPLNQGNANKQVLRVRYYNNFSDRLQEMSIKMPVPDVSKLIIAKDDANALSYFSSKIIYL